MAKARVYELAKEYDVSTKEVISFLELHQIEVTNFSILEDDAAALVRNRYAKKAEAVEHPAKAREIPAADERVHRGSEPGQARPVQAGQPRQGEGAAPGGQETDRERPAQNGGARQAEPGKVSAEAARRERTAQAGNARPAETGKAAAETVRQVRPAQAGNARPAETGKAAAETVRQVRTAQAGNTRPAEAGRTGAEAARRERLSQTGNTRQPEAGKTDLEAVRQGRPAQAGNARPKQAGQTRQGENAAAGGQDQKRERPKKKASISAVYNPQNSKMGDRRSRAGKGRETVQGSVRSDGSRVADRPAAHGQAGGRPERVRRPASEHVPKDAVRRPASEHTPKDVVRRPAAEHVPKDMVRRPASEHVPKDAARRLASEHVPKDEVMQPASEHVSGDAARRLASEHVSADVTRRTGSETTSGEAARRQTSEHMSAESVTRADAGRAAGDGARRAAPECGQDLAGKRQGFEHAAPDQQRRQGGERSARDGSARGDRSQRAGADRPQRGSQERDSRNFADRGPRRFSDRPVRQESGDRNAYSERKDANNQKNYANSRSGGAYRPGSRGGRPDNQNRPRDQRGVRPDQSISRLGRDAAKAPIEELRGKENTHSTRGKKKQDYEKKNRKQEQLINLEKKTGHKKHNAQPQTLQDKKTEEIRTITLPEVMTVRELADKMKVQASEIVKKLFMQGIMMTVNQEIDYEKAEEIALEYNCIAEPEEKVDVIAELLREEEEDESRMVPRPPVVCVMGHVDHGKTSLLDAIRKTRVTDREAGGITQHIGASVVTINGKKITFLDTPGHEAFTAMRMRGANSTDIAILVVAADDGIMPQTVEAINHARAAGIEIIVAINKIDKEGANVERVKQGLTEYDLVAEDWGGSTICVPVSAKTGEGIKELLEMVLLSAEILELKANPNRKARGLVIEARLDKGRGAVATVLVQKGTLNVGQPVAAGSSYGRVRAMLDDKGKRVKEAGPSMPVEILGLNSVPNAGEVFVVCDSEKDARSFADTFVSRNREKLLEETRARMSLDDLFSQIQAGSLKELNLIVKADVQGSVEAVKQSLLKLSNDEVVVKIIHGGVGAISESDVDLASASNAIIIGFNVKPDATAKSTAEQEKVDIRLYTVIYKAIEDIEAAMKGMLDPIFEEKVIGHAEIRQIFRASGVGNIAGSYVLDGVLERGSKIRISREGRQIYEGALASLKRFKDDVKEVRAGYECGLVFEGFNDIAELDIVEAYKMVEVPR